MNSNMEKPYVVGIDIGGTNTVFGIVDARGTIIASSSIKTSGYPTVEEYADEVCKSLLPLIIANGGVDKIRGIGIGAPNGNYYTGTIEFAPNLPWKGILPLAAMFEERLGIPTALTNDANAAAIGEMTYGAARGMKDFIMITLRWKSLDETTMRFPLLSQSCRTLLFLNRRILIKIRKILLVIIWGVT